MAGRAPRATIRIVLGADETEPGAWNLPLCEILHDPFDTAGPIIDAKLPAGFTIEVHDLIARRRISLDCPGGLHDVLVHLGTPSRYVVEHVFRKGERSDPVAARTAAERADGLHDRAGGRRPARTTAGRRSKGPPARRRAHDAPAEPRKEHRA